MRETQEAFPDDLRLVFRHFPLRYHANALNAAIAAEAVARASGENAFWDFHDRLYANPLAISREKLVQHAEAVGADADAVRQALEDEAGKTEVLAQKRSGVRAGVRSSLNLFVDGELFEDDELEDAMVEKVIAPLKAA